MTIKHRLWTRLVIVMHPLENCLLGAIGFPCQAQALVCLSAIIYSARKRSRLAGVICWASTDNIRKIGQRLVPFLHIRSNHLCLPYLSYGVVCQMVLLYLNNL